MIADLKLDDSKKLEKHLSGVGAKVEREINDFIHNKGAKMIVASIIGFMPESKVNKTHAKRSNSLNRITKYNLGVEVKSAKKFNYLVFPDEGIGWKNKVAQDFSGMGLAKVENSIIDKVIEIINENMSIGG